MRNNRALGDKFVKFGMVLGMGGVFANKFKMATKTTMKTNKCRPNISARF